MVLHLSNALAGAIKPAKSTHIVKNLNNVSFYKSKCVLNTILNNIMQTNRCTHFVICNSANYMRNKQRRGIPGPDTTRNKTAKQRNKKEVLSIVCVRID